ncbi:chromosome condensation protein CrcB [Cryobacterium roopkundense]|uniref:Fluoride-specific ion channel FluC n=1 Tax=Cryobacterium roopkundense TaxID=1001240 RepID=A0A099J2J5_9MICO|nr:fluoride efflux transporter CrcB [Cryobacterium roopkundense]KGJ72526.1 chromosome condensation protein CrcB [Cryobacterium roopkundense]MBB5642625.1 CrcB protein [Cryobacterium roopkundense]
MSALTFLAVALAGGLGATVRFVVDGVIRSRLRTPFPLGTTVINVSGSLLLGVVTGLALANLVSADWHLILGGGLLGGYTTFSTASVETVRLLQERRYLPALATGLGMLVASVIVAALGLWLGLSL